MNSDTGETAWNPRDAEEVVGVGEETVVIPVVIGTDVVLAVVIVLVMVTVLLVVTEGVDEVGPGADAVVAFDEQPVINNEDKNNMIMIDDIL